MKLTREVKSLLIETAKDLNGSNRRLVMARAVKAMGKGGQRRAQRELGWDRKIIHKGMHELGRGST